MINSNIQKAIAFIDAQIVDSQTLADGVAAGTEVIILDATKDGISQITEELANRRDISVVHIVSHGAPGCVYLGNAQLSLDTLSKYAQQLQLLFVAGESASPSLFLYGCQVAAGDVGAEFIAKLQTLTGANIVASANLTGNAALGGDWKLEVALGEGEFTSAFTPEMMAAYPAVLLLTYASLGELETALKEQNISISEVAKKGLQDILNTLKPLTFDLQPDSIKATYNGAGSIADILKSVGVPTTTPSPILTGSIDNPSLTIGALNTDNPAYSFSGAIGGKNVTFDYQKNQQLKVAYTGDVSLADLLKNVGVTDTQGSALLTSAIASPNLTVDTSKSPAAYKFSGKISGQEVTLDYQKNQEFKLAYTGDVSLADLLKNVGVTDTQGSALLTGAIASPNLTVDTSKSPAAYKFSGKISGQEVTLDYQKNQEFKLAYTGDISLAELLKNVGVTDTQGSAILTGSINNPSLTVDSSKSPTAYKFSGKISGQEVTLDYQKNQEFKLAYTGDISLAELLKNVGVTDTQGSAILTGSINNPSLTVDSSKSPTAYKFSGKISGQEVTLDYQKNQEFKLAYTGDISLAELLKNVGVTDTQGSAILTGSINNPSLTVDSSKSPTAYKFSGKISGQEVTFEYQKNQELKLAYTGDISLAELLKNVGVTDTQGSAILTGSINNPSLTVDSSKSPTAYKFSGKISGQEVTFEYQKNQELKLAYTGDISLAELLKNVGVTDTQGSAILTGSINNPSLTISTINNSDRTYKFTGNISEKNVELSVSKTQIEVKYNGDFSLADLLKNAGVIVDTDIALLNGTISNASLTIGNLNTTNRSYKFSGKFNGESVGFEIQKDKIQLSYEGTISLADVLKKVGITVENDVSILNNSISDASLTISKFNSKNPNYQLTGKISGETVAFDFAKDTVKLGYKGETSLSNLLKGVPGVETIVAELSVPISDPSFAITKLNTKSPSYELSGIAKFNVNDGRNNFVDFINDKLGIQQLTLTTKVDATGASVKGAFDTNILLFNKNNFSATLTKAELKLAVAKKFKPSFGIAGRVLLKSYDPFQTNEPDLTVIGGLSLEPKSLTASFQLELDPKLPWTNPFGLANSEIRGLAFQLGGTYLTPYISNIGVFADVKVDKNDVKLGLLVDTTDPEKFAMELTAYQPLGLADLLLGPLNSYNSQRSNKSEFVNKIDSFLKSALDVNVVSIDGDDADTELDPLIKFVPAPTSIGDKSLQEGFAINGKLYAWGKEASLQIDANPFSSSPSLSGKLKIPEIDLGNLKLTGGNDRILDVDLKLNSGEQYLKADAGLELFGQKVATFDLSIDKTEIKLKNFKLGWSDVLAIEIDKFNLNASTLSGSASGKIKLFGNELANASFSLNNGNLSISGKLGIDVKGYKLGVDVEIALGKENRIRMDVDFVNQRYNIVNLSVDPFVEEFKNGVNSLTTKVGDILLGAVGDVVGYAKNLLNEGLSGVSKLGSYVVEAGSNLYKSIESFASGLLTSNSVSIFGKEFNEKVEGNDNNDVLFGNGGNDTLAGRLRRDLIDGGTGDDQLLGGNNEDTINGGDGNDKIYGQGHSDTIYGGAGDDYIDGEGDDNQRDFGDDEIHGGLGNDTAEGGNHPDKLYGDGGDDLLNGNDGADSVYGGDGNDTLKGELQTDILGGGAGNDQLYGGVAADTLYGDEGNDSLYGEDYDDQLYGWKGNDLLVGAHGYDTLYGDQDNDTLSGGIGNNLLDGGDGNDWVDYSFLNSSGVAVDLSEQRAIFNEGRDRLVSIENVIGSRGNDKITGDSQDNILSGGGGTDSLYGSGGNDTLTGDGLDFLDGGEGSDFANYSYITNGIQANLSQQKLTFAGGIQDTFVSIENVIGGSGNDKSDGNSENNIFIGNGGNDTLSGDSGDDSLYGGDGNDVLNGGTGNNLLDGGTGNDRVDYSFWNNGIVANLAQEKVTFSGNSDADKIVSVERIDGSSGNDSIVGDDRNNVFLGEAGNDSLYGADGDDEIYGGVGNDLIQGGSGKDTLFGREGNDDIAGNAGNDVIYGDEGDDKLSGDGGNDRIFGNDGKDTLSGGEGDDYLDAGGGDDILRSGSLEWGDLGNDTIDGGVGDDTLILMGNEDDYNITELNSSTGKGWKITRQNSVKIVTNVETIEYDNSLPLVNTSNFASNLDSNDSNSDSNSDTNSDSNSEDNSEGISGAISKGITKVSSVIDAGATILKFKARLFRSAFNGPLADSTVFVDTNGNFKPDEGELQTTTDDNGQYNFDESKITALDVNGDGKIDSKEGQIVAIGGTDTTTGLPATLPLISQVGSATEATITTPLTTLKAVLESQGIAAEQVETLLEKISGLPLASLSQPLDDFDPYAAIGKDDTTGINIASGHIKVMNLLLNGTAFLKAAKYQGSDAEIAVIIALGEVLQQVDTFDLSKGDDLQKLFTELTAALQLNVAGDVIPAVAELVAQSNHLVDNLVTQALTRSVSDVLPSISPIKKAVYSNLPQITQQLVEGKITAQESQTQLQKFLSADTFLVQYALNEKRTVKVSAGPTLTEGDTNSQGQFTISLGEVAPPQGLKILYTLSGSATLGQDYDAESGLFGEINIAPGATEAIIKLSIKDDILAETPESITLNLKYVGDGYALDPVYKTAVLQIADNDADDTTNESKGIQKIGTFGNDNLTGSAGDDDLFGEAGKDFLQGLAGDDLLIADAGDDRVLGGEGNDDIEGNFGADILQGNAGDDVLAGGAGNDSLQGNEGYDELQGNAGDDEQQGNEQSDFLQGGYGNDTLEGNEENDWLVGGEGQDILIGGEGVDLLNGGDGADIFFFNAASEGGDLILDFDPSQGDKIQVSDAGFNTNSIADFSAIAGNLYYKDRELALIQNNGKTYNHFGNLSEVVEIVSKPTAQPKEAVSKISAQIAASVANADLVKNPQNTILDDVIKRGAIKVGSSSVGSEFDFDFEFARTLAAALFGDASKIERVTTTFSQAFKYVVDGTVDIAAQRSTHYLEEDAEGKVDFSPIYFYDFQAVVVRKDSGIENALDLKGRTIGIIEDSNSLDDLKNQLSPQGVEFIPKLFNTLEEIIAAYNAGNIDAFATDRALILDRLKTFSNPENHHLLDVEFSKEPIGLTLPENDSQWADVVRWVNYVPIQAEEFGINSQNIEEIIAANTDENLNNDSPADIRRFLGIEGDLGATLGLPKDFAVNVIKQVGNYGEIYERHFSGVDRDRNLLWTEGGLLYSPPFSGSKIDATLVDNDARNLLADVLQRGTLKLGLPDNNNPGFAVEDADGKFMGFDVDLGRAIAAALFGDPTKLEIQVQSFKDSFANTANGVVDVSAMGITQNFVRDASLGVDFSPTYLYTGQGVLVKADSGISVLPALNGRRIGVLEGTTSLENLENAFSKFGATFIPVKFATNDELFAAYDRGEVDAISNDLPLLSSTISTLSNPEQHLILDEVLSKEPLALITDENQSEWADVVRWVYNALVQAEELGITSANIDELLVKNTDANSANDSTPDLKKFLGLEGNAGESLGLPNNFAVKVIKAVGNYGEMYDRHFNSNVLQRDSNALAADFGLQYSLPFADTTGNDKIIGTEGNDLLNGNGEDNSLNGNKGNDTLYGGQGNDTVWGGKGNDILFGGKGNDILFGGKGSDTLNGNAGDDLLNGGKGNDILFGGKGSDTLNGGAGDDLLNGGKGRDTFVLTPGNGTDAIADFTIGQDLLGLAGGLKFEQLTITQGTGTQAGDTLIRLASTGAVLASLAGSSASSITPAMFTLN